MRPLDDSGDGLAADASLDPFSAMRVRRIARPFRSAISCCTSPTDVPSLVAFRGKAVLLEFFLPG